MKRILFLFIICSAMIGACSKSSTNPGYTSDCTGVAKSFSNDVSPIIQSACVRCHSKFSSYSGIAADKAAIRSAITNGSMPQGSSISTIQKNSVVCWIDSGTPNN